MALDRKKMSQALTNGLARPASNPYGEAHGSSARTTVRCRKIQEGGRADQGVRQAGRVQDAVHRDAARPRQCPDLPAAVEEHRRQHGDRAGRQATFPPRAFPAQVRGHRLAHRRLPGSRCADVRQLLQQEPGQLANYTNPELDALLEHARVTPDEAKRIEDYCAISRILNKEATWFWTFQNTYYAMAKAR